MPIFPTAKILIYNTSDALTHTITSDILNVSVTPAVTSQIGTFSFMLPGKKTHSYVYNDIGNNYKAKLYLGYGTLGTNDLQLVGKILRFDSTKELKGGFYRIFSGKDQGEILERRLKTNRRYEELDASTIVVVDIATELGIYSVPNAGKVETDETEETITVRTEQYLDYLRKVSDYWYDGNTKVQKDFFMDNDNELMWWARPLRTATTNVTGTADSGNTTTTVDTQRTESVADYWRGCFILYTSGTNSGLQRLITAFNPATDTITHLPFPAVVDAGDAYSITGVSALTASGVNANILTYRLTYDITPVKNSLTVFGAPTSFYPIDKDTFTEALSGTYRGNAWAWTAASGSLLLSPNDPKYGTYTINCTDTSAPKSADMTLTLPQRVNLRTINTFSFWIYTLDVDTVALRLQAPDNSNYFEATLSCGYLTWLWFNGGLGESNEYDADENPTGIWTKTGSPNWWNITAVRFIRDTVTDDAYLKLDKLYFSPDRWVYTAEDSNARGKADAGGDTTHTIDAERTEIDDYWNGYYLIDFTSGANNGLSRLITDFDVATHTLTHSAFPFTAGVGASYSIVTSASSINNFGLREGEFTDDNLLSEAECQKRAETLLYQLKDRSLALEVALQGNMNIKIGDRLPVTLPADNISALDFDVVSATHNYQKKPLGLRTNASLIYGLTNRMFPPRTPVESVQRKLSHLNAVTSELYSRVVR